MAKLETAQDQLESNQLAVEEKAIDLQCRSMRENLLFTGILEPDDLNENSENPEAVLREFLATKMNITDEIQFDRVHRLGKLRPNELYPRLIIAKFHRYKDREKVRLAAPKALVGSPYGVREQYPTEIETVRRTLYPVMKKAKENKDNKVRLVRDRLFINDQEYIPKSMPQKRPVNATESQHKQTNQRQGTWLSNTQKSNLGPSYQRTRVFTSRKPSVPTVKDNFTTPNRFSALNVIDTDDDDDDTIVVNSTENRKQKASSPLENQQTTKKARENSLTDDRNGCVYSQDPPQEPMECQIMTSEPPTCKSPQPIECVLANGPTVHFEKSQSAVNDSSRGDDVSQ